MRPKGPPFKRRLITLGRIVKTGGINYVRNAWLAIAATSVMVITLTILLFSVIANATFANTLKQLTDKIDISIYLKDEVAPEQRDGLIAQLKGMENIRSVEYRTKEQALEDYKKQNQNNPDLLQAISQTDNPLPATLRVKPADPDKIEDIRDFLEKPEIKTLQSDETSYSGDRKEAIDKITASTSFLRKAGVAGVIIFMVVSILLIFNTIRMTIFNRRDELTIMRLLGANTWYIRGPFVVETIMYGVIAAIISVAICNTLFAAQSSGLGAGTLNLLDISFAKNYLSENFMRILFAQLGIGIVIGAISSFIATRRYLKFNTSK